MKSTFYIWRCTVSAPALHSIDVSNAGAGHKKHLTVAHPNFVTELEIFPTPNVETLIIQSQFKEKFSWNRKESTSLKEFYVQSTFYCRLTIAGDLYGSVTWVCRARSRLVSGIRFQSKSQSQAPRAWPFSSPPAWGEKTYVSPSIASTKGTVEIR